MKKFVLVLLSLLASSTYAAPMEYFDAVMKSDAMMKLQSNSSHFNVVSMKNTETYRCPGCYKFEVEYQNGLSDQIMKTNFYTRKTNFVGADIIVFNKD